MSKDAASRLGYQMELKVEGPIDASELLKKSVVNPSKEGRAPCSSGILR